MINPSRDTQTSTGDVAEAHLGPRSLIQVQRVHVRLTLDVRLVVRKQTEAAAKSSTLSDIDPRARKSSSDETARAAIIIANQKRFT